MDDKHYNNKEVFFNTVAVTLGITKEQAKKIWIGIQIATWTIHIVSLFVYCSLLFSFPIPTLVFTLAILFLLRSIDKRED